MKTIALGMSGGVDSSVAVLVLQAAGYRVTGVTLRFQDGPQTEAAMVDARAVCAKLGIDHVDYPAQRLFREEVIDPFIDAYRERLTPSPCPLCNAHAKMPALIAAADALGCDFVATGHYARIVELQNDAGDVRWAVKTALDARKDQSYMLAGLSQDQLARLVLPLGGLTKTDVRLMAADAGLEVAEKADSQDICFAPDGYRAFLAANGFTDEPGQVVSEAGEVLGEHTGLSDYTIGQRKGLGVSASEPYYVLEKDVAANRLVVGFADRALISEVIVDGVVWQVIATLAEPMDAMVKLRYRATAQAATVYPINEGSDAGAPQRIRVVLREPQTTTAPGQFAAFSIGDTILGGGTIREVIRK